MQTLTASTDAAFQFEGRNVCLLDLDGEAWFFASDIARELGYEHTPHLMRVLEEDEKGVHSVDTLGGRQIVSIVSEPGVYHAIMQRRANKAHDESLKARIVRFQRFVTHDVLPSIRKTGSYAAPAVAPALPDFKNPAAAARAWAEQYEARDVAEAKVAELAPKAAFVDRFVEAGGRYGLQNAGRALGCRPNKFIDWLKSQGFVFYSDGSLVPRQQYLQSGLFEVKNTVGVDDKVHTQSFVTPKGVSYFAARVPATIRSREPATALAAPDSATAH
jgi:prophage antirepressor-like protein